MTVRQFCLLLVFSFFTAFTYAEDRIPADVRYMIEDLYGEDRSQWPKPVYRQDVNHDGQQDWVAQQPGCRDKTNCQVDLFICKQGDAQSCTEYCYVGSGLLKVLLSNPDKLKCQSTC